MSTGVSTEWMLSAPCAQVDAEIFFPEKGQSSEPAKLVCSGCPYRAPCLLMALREPALGRHGVWGGLSSHEIQDVRREWLGGAA